MSVIATMDGYSEICSVLDAVTSSSDRPASWRSAIYAAIDHLHASSAPDEEIETAERISVNLLKLEWAIQKGDTQKQETARQQLTKLGDAWRSGAATQSMSSDLQLPESESINDVLERLNRRSM